MTNLFRAAYLLFDLKNLCKVLKILDEWWQVWLEGSEHDFEENWVKDHGLENKIFHVNKNVVKYELIIVWVKNRAAVLKFQIYFQRFGFETLLSS